jgi:hypothetical protein
MFLPTAGRKFSTLHDREGDIVSQSIQKSERTKVANNPAVGLITKYKRAG